MGKIINGGIRMADIKYEIKETLGELSESSKTWRKN